MRILITQISSFKKDAESVRCEATYVLDRASTTMTVELCKQIAETKGVHIVTYTDDADMLFRLGQIINKSDTFVVGSIYSKLPKSVLAEYKIEQIGKKAAAKKPAKAAEPKAAEVKKAEPKKAEPKKAAIKKDEPASPSKKAEAKSTVKKETKTTNAKSPAKKADTAKTTKKAESEAAVSTPAPAVKKPRKKKGEDVSAYVENASKYITEVKDDDLVYVIRLVREAVRSCGDDRMAKGFCKSKLKKEFGDDVGTQLYETIDAKYIWIKSAVGM